MGQKVNPISFRIGFTERWKSCWFANGNKYGELVCNDYKIRKYLEDKLGKNIIIRIDIARVFNSITIYLTCTDIGAVMGENGSRINAITSELEKINKCSVQINVSKNRNEKLIARAVVSSLANQINLRVPYKMAIKQVLELAQRLRLDGIKIIISGRLGGAEIARSEKFSYGKVPSHTMRALIDYYCGFAETIYGVLGIKVWIFKGEIYKRPKILLAVGRDSEKNMLENNETKTSHRTFEKRENINKYATTK